MHHHHCNECGFALTADSQVKPMNKITHDTWERTRPQQRTRPSKTGCNCQRMTSDSSFGKMLLIDALLVSCVMAKLTYRAQTMHLLRDISTCGNAES